jgi:hypothetical protein
MIDLASATSRSMAVSHLQGSAITNSLPMVSQMGTAIMQNTGVYDLIYPVMHVNYPTRDEIDLLIQTTLLTHHLANWHLPISSPLGSPGATVVQPVQLIPKETMAKSVMVRAGSPVNSVGYGI